MRWGEGGRRGGGGGGKRRGVRSAAMPIHCNHELADTIGTATSQFQAPVLPARHALHSPCSRRARGRRHPLRSRPDPQTTRARRWNSRTAAWSGARPSGASPHRRRRRERRAPGSTPGGAGKCRASPAGRCSRACALRRAPGEPAGTTARRTARLKSSLSSLSCRSAFFGVERVTLTKKKQYTKVPV